VFFLDQAVHPVQNLCYGPVQILRNLPPDLDLVQAARQCDLANDGDAVLTGQILDTFRQEEFPFCTHDGSIHRVLFVLDCDGNVRWIDNHNIGHWHLVRYVVGQQFLVQLLAKMLDVRIALVLFLLLLHFVLAHLQFFQVHALLQ